MPRRVTAVVALTLAVVVVAGVVPVPVVASSHELTSPSAVDTPDRTETFRGSTFEITETARVSPGDDVEIQVAGPSGDEYPVELRDTDQQLVDVGEAPPGGSVTFSTGSLSPGTYLALLYDGADIEAVLPVVVEGYSVDEDVPGTATADTGFEVSATLTERGGAPSPSSVEAVVSESGSEEIVTRRTLSADGPMSYSGSVTVSESGDYDVHVFVRGQDELNGERVLLGLSDPRSLDVAVNDGTSTPTDSTAASDDDEPAGGDGGDAAPSDETATDTDTPSDRTTEQSTTPVPTTANTDSEPSTDSTATGASTTSEEFPVGALPILSTLLLAGGLATRVRRRC